MFHSLAGKKVKRKFESDDHSVNHSTVRQPRLFGPRLYGFQFCHELVVILKTQTRKKPNNPFRRLFCCQGNFMLDYV